MLGGYRYSPPPSHPPSHYPGYTSPRSPCTELSCMGTVPRLNMAVGLKTVVQLTLGAQISRFKGITEVYNLVRIDRTINHFVIPGND